MFITTQSHRYSKSPYIIICALIFFACLFLFTLKTASAQTNATPDPYVNCDDTRTNEFHSLRPYQASPCNQNYDNLSLFCGNDFILHDQIVIEKIYYDIPWYEPGGGQFADSDFSYPFSWDFILRNSSNGDEICAPFDGHDKECMRIPPICYAYDCISDGTTETCNFTVDREVDIAINLEGSRFPIMGFTEPSQGNQSDPYRVVNYYTDIDDETMENPEKVNEYVSWYLSGVIGRKEYGAFNQSTQEGRSMNIDYSGPIKRLLPFESQITTRIEEVEDTLASLDCDPSAVPQDPNCIRHDQIIACSNILGQPVGECPSFSTRRLSEWGPGLLGSNYPPLPSDPEFDTLQEYFDALDIWRLLHRTTQYTFRFIPFSSTEDRKGNVFMSEYEYQPIYSPGTSLICSSITDQMPADLFFSHMQESAELADLLQQIHSPQNADLDGLPMNVRPIDITNCDIAETRTNPGDELFSGEITATAEYTADVTCDNFFVHGDGRLCEALPGDTRCYDSDAMDEFECDAYYNAVDCPDADYGAWCGLNCTPIGECWPENQICELCIVNADGDSECTPASETYDCCPGLDCNRPDIHCTDPDDESTCYRAHTLCGPGDPITEDSWGSYSAGTCTKDVYVSFKTNTTTPLAVTVWSKLVSGPFGAFRRIFPQIEDSEGRPIRRLWDIPAETNVSYIVEEGDIEVVGGTQHSLYFPHIGGVHEYFLNCLQKTLRPQGFGQGCVNAPEPPPPPPPPPPGTPPPSNADCFSFGVCTVCYLCDGVAGDVAAQWKNFETDETRGLNNYHNLGTGECVSAFGWECDGPGGFMCEIWGGNSGGALIDC